MLKLKAIAVASVVLLSACAALEGSSGTTTSSSSDSARLKACSMEEGLKRVQDGSAFTQGLTASAKDIASSCVKKLALEDAGVNVQATEDATNALKTLMNSAGNVVKK